MPGGGQLFTRRRRTQVTQRPKTEAIAGNGPELPSHRFDQIAPVRLFAGHYIEHYREDGGEPPDGAGEVDVVEDVFAAVAFQIDRHPAASGTAGQSPG